MKPKVSFDNFSSLDFVVGKIISAPLAEGTRNPCRVLEIDIGNAEVLLSVGQYVLVPENELVGTKVIVCRNLGEFRMGKYKSQCLVLGTKHPDSDDKSAQAIPIRPSKNAKSGEQVY